MPEHYYHDRTGRIIRSSSRFLTVILVASALETIRGLLGRREDPKAEVERAVHEVREEMGRGRPPATASYRPQPTPDQVRARREERRRREAEEAHR